MILLHIHDQDRRPPASRKLGGAWSALAVPLEGAGDIEICRLRNCLIDADVTTPPNALRLRSLSGRLERDGRRIVACDRADPRVVTQAQALGATGIVGRPIDDGTLLHLLDGVEPGDDLPASTIVGAIALDLAFRSITDTKPLAPGYVERVAASIAEDVGDLGLEAWLAAICAHHSGIYQHCLIVTGLATAFGQALHLPGRELEKLTVAALLHDIGKARIDSTILDKSSGLTPQERTIVEMHPVWGEEHLRRHAAMAEEVLDAVRHHHELLDGSGYPDNLQGDRISDLTRLLTIADIFGALVERRAYKPPMSGEAAFAIIDRMTLEGKLERDLVEAFRPVAARLKDQPAPDSA